MKEKFFYIITIISSCILMMSFLFIAGMFGLLELSYPLEQIFWAISATSFGILYISILFGFILVKDKKNKTDNEALKKKKKKISQIYAFRLLSISISILVFDVLIYMYLKSIFSLDDLNIIIGLNHPIGIILYIIFWIGVIIFLIAAIMLYL